MIIMSYWTNLYRTVADNELHFFTISNLNYTVFVSLARMLKGMSYLELFICVRSLLKILYSVPFVRPCILVTCGGTIRHRAFIS